MSSRLKRIMNQSRRFMKLVEHSCSIGWKVHEQAWNMHEIEFALMWSQLTKGVC